MSMRYAKTKGQLHKRIGDRIYKPRREAIDNFNRRLERSILTVQSLVEESIKQFQR